MVTNAFIAFSDTRRVDVTIWISQILKALGTISIVTSNIRSLVRTTIVAASVNLVAVVAFYAS